MQEFVVLVNQKDEKIGLMEKQEAHIKGALHRAFSVFLFNKNGETLLQQRAADKYHSPLLWTNTCCSHPRDRESYLEGATRRLQEEMGIKTELKEKFHFIYKADVGQKLTEHELDYVFIGNFDGEPSINTKEAAAYKWVSISEITSDIKKNPKKYTEWFKIIFKEYLDHL